MPESNAGAAPKQAVAWSRARHEHARRIRRDRDLSPSTKIVVEAILDLLRTPRPTSVSVRTLQRETGIKSTSTVKKAVEDAERAGYLTVARGGHSRARSAFAIPDRFRSAPIPGADDPAACPKNWGSTAPKIGTAAAPKTGTAAAPKIGADLPQKLGQHIPQPHLPQLPHTAITPAEGVSDQHEVLYAAYPRKIGKLAALKAIERALAHVKALNHQPDPYAWLLGRVQAYAAARAGQDPQYTPHPATWFNQRRFDDDPHEWSRRGNGVRGSPAMREVIDVPNYLSRAPS